MKNRQKRKGFTLIEMLVVIAIIALLASLTVPVVQGVLEKSRTIHCASNMKQLGQIMVQYATDHGGRWPGKAYRTVPSGSAIAWNLMLDDYIGEDKVVNNIDLNDYGKPSQILCLSKKKYKGSYTRNYAMNAAAAGGNVDSNTPNGNGLGVMNNPAKNPDWAWHLEGAMVIASTRPSKQFLLIETERSTDYASPNWPYGSLDMEDNGNYPPWSGESGVFSFRHNGRGNFLYMDLHVSTLEPDGEINTAENFFYNY